MITLKQAGSMLWKDNYRGMSNDDWTVFHYVQLDPSDVALAFNMVLQLGSADAVVHLCSPH
ncbi:hypothetical protein Ancab_004022 [Ancistrocladus abbreviatus]